jgi:hypothetical protein
VIGKPSCTAVIWNMRKTPEELKKRV